ncbi:MAG: SH3 domain-containing protein, partial [Myxococcales bacterium]|nr:SH3 domain-containing protein [Myxococcales bacterium]
MTRSILLSTTILMALACGGMGSEPAVTPPEPAAVAPEPAAPRPPPEPSLDGYYGYAPGHDGVHDALYATFSEGEQPYVGVDDANLRATADTSSEVVAVLPLASRVTVIESSGKPVELLDRRNEWVRVRTEEGVQGWVFGAILTPWAGEVEDQMSGEPQGTWAVTFAPDFRPRLRVQPTGSPAVGLDLTVTERFRGGRLEAATEAYGDFDTRIRVTLCRVDHGDQPECASAIAASGQEAWRQVTPPDAWRYEPDTGMGCEGGVVRAAVVTTSQDVATLELPSYMRGPSTTLDCAAVGRFTEGPRAKQRVIGCTQGDGGKSDPGYLVTRWFAEEAEARWAALPCADGGTELGSELIAAFVERSIALTSDPETALGPPFVLPETLDAPRGTITRRWHALGDIAGGRVLFTAPGVGEVRETTGEFRGALAVRPPQGGTVLYQWEPDDTSVEWDDGRDPGHSESYDVGVGDCGGSLTTFQDV